MFQAFYFIKIQIDLSPFFRQQQRRYFSIYQIVVFAVTNCINNYKSFNYNFNILIPNKSTNYRQTSAILR